MTPDRPLLYSPLPPFPSVVHSTVPLLGIQIPQLISRLFGRQSGVENKQQKKGMLSINGLKYGPFRKQITLLVDQNTAECECSLDIPLASSLWRWVRVVDFYTRNDRNCFFLFEWADVRAVMGGPFEVARLSVLSVQSSSLSSSELTILFTLSFVITLLVPDRIPSRPLLLLFACCEGREGSGRPPDLPASKIPPLLPQTAD